MPMPIRIPALATAVLAGALASAAAGHAQAQGINFYPVANAAVCVDVSGGRFVAGTPVQLWDCHGKLPQQFKIDSVKGQIFPVGNPSLCVDDIAGQGLALVDCARVRFRWTFEPNNNRVHNNAGRCWDVTKGYFKRGTRMIMWPCHGKPPQQLAARS